MEFIILAVILLVCAGLVWKFAWPKDDITSPQPEAPYKLDFDLSSMAPAFPEKSKEIEFDPDATPVPPLTRADLQSPDITTPTIKFKAPAKKTAKATKDSVAWKSSIRAKPRKPRKPKLLK